ncbi:MAG: GFA family protein [Deltaproteobacteria bacterium]|nr:GFA family protein [Deltaproteobacteria bacterium]
MKTFHGSCICGAVTFEADLDLAAGTTRCNCSFCRKARFWMAFARGDGFRLRTGLDHLVDYQRTPAGRPEPYLHFLFCRTCGARPFTRGGDGEFHAVNLGCLDDATDLELAAAPVHFADGRHRAWEDDATATHYI